jgi:ribose-phosphate pyrophosphokinase
LVADLLNTSGIQRIVLVDLHSRPAESAFAMPVEHLSAVPILAETVRASLRENTVVVSPDLGAVKMAERYARILNLPVAIIHKTRISGEEVSVQRIVGDVRGKEVLVVDDMISTGGTMLRAALACRERGANAVHAIAAHGLFGKGAKALFDSLAIDRIIVTDSVASAASAKVDYPSARLDILPAGSLIGEAVKRLHSHSSISDLLGIEN